MITKISWFENQTNDVQNQLESQVQPSNLEEHNSKLTKLMFLNLLKEDKTLEKVSTD
jgi:hypothetical protein